MTFDDAWCRFTLPQPITLAFCHEDGTKLGAHEAPTVPLVGDQIALAKTVGGPPYAGIVAGRRFTFDAEALFVTVFLQDPPDPSEENHESS